jgi:preprotein translocase subunit SecD
MRLMLKVHNLPEHFAVDKVTVKSKGRVFNMAATVHNLPYSVPSIQLNLVSKASAFKYNTSQSETSDIKMTIRDGALEIRLDIDELREFYPMCTRTTVRSYIIQLITCLENVGKDFPDFHKKQLN